MSRELEIGARPTRVCYMRRSKGGFWPSERGRLGLRAMLECRLKRVSRADVRRGEIVLLIDSDTRVPSDCLLDASLEMSTCPDVAIM